ncbi:LysR substrate-binding domain-containing protein [Paraburkholderia sp. BCC1885]|jgi:LysR family glycine cleavage system transcriptional activator|uniref:LysR substrate-binding domain-containing protein n=1 Tax=Paraburkholderia sp. BCC1885 TaxID=2562669 RepID=UPI00118268A8|nr:LysR substrate-binding domain-containing protein [Paraburkholderia sp. BCC1885]
MFKPLPPLQALRALEAACRHRSFTRAADELNLTHSAISHHLRNLEDALGTPLFRRVGARMIPTSVGARLAERVRVGLAEIEDALTEARAGDRAGTVRLEVSAMSDLAGNWLIRRLNGFATQYPHIELMLRVHAQIVPPDPYTADLGIWHKPVNEPGFVSHKLIDDQLIAVVSPALLARIPNFRVADTRKLPMLRFAHRSWRDWLEAAGLPLHEPTFGPIFDNPDSLLQAAIAGQGAVTARRLLVRDAIEQGALVQIGTVCVPASLEYFVSWREHHPREPEILAFYEWMREQLAS